MLGNGFDLAHYLPTAYVHFMDAMMVVESNEEAKELGFDNLFQKYISGKCSDRDKEFFQKTKELYKTDDLKLSVDIVKELQEKLKNNGWFQHFKNHLTDVDTWIDFEDEIEKVLTLLGVLFNIEFEYDSIINFDKDRSLGLDIAENIIGTDSVLFNKILVDRAGLKSHIINSILKEFKIFNTIYGVRLRDKHSDQDNFKKITKDEFDIFQELIEFNADVAGVFYSHKKEGFSEVINKKYLKRLSNIYTGFKEDEIFKKILNNLETFSEIFTSYIDLVINNLEPVKPFYAFGDLNQDIEAVYTFNYSSTFERLYPSSFNKEYDQVQYIHGSAERENIVLGISDLDEKDLKKYKIYGFVKTFQKLINNTDYNFLHGTDLRVIRTIPREVGQLRRNYEILIWGHSLDVSDAEYIKEMFALNNESLLNRVTIEVWYHGSPHTQLANLMHIMGKNIIQEWMKKGWLSFKTQAPDVYELNNGSL